MKVVFTGLSYFTSKFVKELKEFDTSNKYVFCNTYTSKLDQIKFGLHLLNADLVISFNGVTSESGALNLALKLKKKIMLQWQGTDVLSVKRNLKSGAFTDKYIKNSKSFTDAKWLQEELSEYAISSDILHFKHLEIKKGHSKFNSLQVLIYVATDKEKFYGLHEVLILAKKFPEVIFNVIGTKGVGFDAAENVKYLGWVNSKKVKTLMDECPIVVRLTEHDGYSLSVLEALANGNYVLWNNPHPRCTYVKHKNELVSKFSEIIDEVKVHEFNRSFANVKWAEDNLKSSNILNNFVKTISEL